MNLQNLNFNELRVFVRVFEHKSMTLAAQELHLTQSGVSQHIKNLEISLDVKLFDRLQRKLIPTLAAKELYESCRKSLSELQKAIDSIRGDVGILRGRFRFAAPYEFGKNILTPVLGPFLEKNPNLKFHLELGFSSDFLVPLLNGELDAAVVDAFATHPSLKTEKIYEENLELCFSKESVKNFSFKNTQAKKDFLINERYVDYNISAPLIDAWMRHHFGKIQGSPQIVASSGQAQVLAQWIIDGVGAAVLPHHFLEGYAHKLKAFPTTKSPLKNALYLATLKGRQSPVVDALKKARVLG